MNKIDSVNNPKLKAWAKLKQKKYRTNFFLCDQNLCDYAYKYHYLDTLIYKNEMPFPFENSYQLSEKAMAKLSDEDYIGIVKTIENKEINSKRVIILEDLQDPKNVGTLIKCAQIYGYDVAMSENCCDLYNEKCLSAAQDSLFTVNIYQGDIKETILNLKEKNYQIIATGLWKDTLALSNIKQSDKMAFILGNEGSGVKSETKNISDQSVKIEMSNIDSLNVAVAGNIIMYKFSM